MAPAKRAKVPSDAPPRRSERTSTKRSSAAEVAFHDEPRIDVYDDEEEATSSAMADRWLFDIKSKLDSPAFDNLDLIQKLDPKDFNLEFVKKTGLVKPLLFEAPPTELGMKMPNAARFGVNDVKKLVSPEREIEVVVVKTQTSKKMTMQEFANYYKKKAEQRKNLLNVLSLEFSMTPLEQKVRAPELIKSIDWVELYWPSALRKRQEFLNNPPADVSTYPKVQNYCLMSVSDCYTDFHIDFGGTSVWYHVLKGEKIFFMIEPTEQNIKVYEGWTLSGSDQNKTFFGDIVVKCARVRLVAGNTFVIPSGWIHAVYTPADSLVFGGNFLHSYAIPMQLRVYQSESITHVRKRYRYPYFIQMLWYVAERMVRRATGRCYLAEIKSELPVLPVVAPTVRSSDSRTSSADSQLVDPDYVATDASLMDTSTESYIVVDDIESKEKATKDPDDSKQPPSQTMSVLERSQAPLSSGETATRCSPPPQLERADSEQQRTEVADNASSQLAPGERLPFAFSSPAFSSATESEGEDGRKPPANKPFSPVQNLATPERKPFTPADKFDDKYLASLTSFERDGINALMQFLMRLTEKNRELGEGILEPDHILKDLQCTFTRACELMNNPTSSSIIVDQSQESIDVENNEKPPVADISALPPKKATPPPSLKKAPAAPKRRSSSGAGAPPSSSSSDAASSGPKKPRKKKQSDAKEKSLTPPLPPVVPAKFHGFDPMTELVALGHKPLATAFRMGPNMATPPSAIRPLLPRSKPLEVNTTGEVGSSDPRSQISPSLDGHQPSPSQQQPPRSSALPIVHRQKPQQQQQHLQQQQLQQQQHQQLQHPDASWPPTSPAIRPGDPRRQAALHQQQQLLRAAMVSDSSMAAHYAAAGLIPHGMTSFGNARAPLRHPHQYPLPSVTSPSHMYQQQQQQFAYPSYRPGFAPQPVPSPMGQPLSLSTQPDASLFRPILRHPPVSTTSPISPSSQQLDGQPRSRPLPSPLPSPYTPLNQGSQGAAPISPFLAGVPSPVATTSHFGGGFFAPPSATYTPTPTSKRPSLSSAEQFPMGPPKLLIPHLAATQSSAAADISSERPRMARTTSGNVNVNAKEDEKLEGEATISALDELTRALNNEPSPQANKEPEPKEKEDTLEEEQPIVDPLSWADELASLTQVMTEN